MSASRWAARAGALGALVVTAALPPAAVLPTPAAARPAAEPPAGTVTLQAQEPWLALGGSETLHLSVENASPGVEVVVTVYEALTSNISFQRTLEREDLGSTIGQVAAPLDALKRDCTDQDALFPIVLDPAVPSTLGFANVRQQGVYPMVVELRDPQTGLTGEGFVSYIVAVDTAREPGPVGEPLRFAWLWQLVAYPALLPDGDADPEVVAELEPTGRLGRLATAIPPMSDVPITLVPSPETLQSWAALASASARDTDSAADGDSDGELPVPLPAGKQSALAPGIEAIRRATTNGQQVLAGPYVPVDLPSLLEHGLAGDALGELTVGARTLDDVLSTRIDPRTAFVDPVNDSTLRMLADTAVDRVVLEQSSLVPVSSQFTPARPFALAGGGALVSVATDSFVASLLDGDGPPALRAQHFLAALSVIALEQPNVARGIVVAEPLRWDADFDVLSNTLAGLGGNPLIDPVHIDTLFDEVALETDETDDHGELLVREREEPLPSPLLVAPEDYRSAQEMLDAFRALVPPTDPRVAQGERALLVALSSLWSGEEGQARVDAELHVIDESVNEVLSLVSAAEDRTVTITARRAEIPITFRNDSDEPIRVRVELASDKLTFPEGSVFIIELPPRNTTKQFLVEARTSGTFPLELTVSSPDGRLDFQRSRLTVRSTAVSGVGVVLTVAAAAFLALWWMNHIIRARRAKRRRNAA